MKHYNDCGCGREENYTFNHGCNKCEENYEHEYEREDEDCGCRKPYDDCGCERPRCARVYTEKRRDCECEDRRDDDCGCDRHEDDCGCGHEHDHNECGCRFRLRFCVPPFPFRCRH